jgi:hypothetical protein
MQVFFMRIHASQVSMVCPKLRAMYSADLLKGNDQSCCGSAGYLIDGQCSSGFPAQGLVIVITTLDPCFRS